MAAEALSPWSTFATSASAFPKTSEADASHPNEGHRPLKSGGTLLPWEACPTKAETEAAMRREGALSGPGPPPWKSGRAMCGHLSSQAAKSPKLPREGDTSTKPCEENCALRKSSLLQPMERAAPDRSWSINLPKAAEASQRRLELGGASMAGAAMKSSSAATAPSKKLWTDFPLKEALKSSWKRALIFRSNRAEARLSVATSSGVFGASSSAEGLFESAAAGLPFDPAPRAGFSATGGGASATSLGLRHSPKLKESITILCPRQDTTT
mmetsp:Transcript_25879/g.55008  ORF Transcript_25879/g.55008 Transcript_25879/m.55008 type:complete len:269 (+) Transcript_25879:448-1254(+)